MSYISQNTDLFNDTIEYNITFGNTSEKINKKLEYSLKASNLVKFVEELPDGLKTVVGRRGPKYLQVKNKELISQELFIMMQKF